MSTSGCSRCFSPRAARRIWAGCIRAKEKQLHWRCCPSSSRSPRRRRPTTLRYSQIMRAIAVDKLKGEPRLLEVAQPVAKPDQLLVKIAATALNPFDWKVADGI